MSTDRRQTGDKCGLHTKGIKKRAKLMNVRDYSIVKYANNKLSVDISYNLQSLFIDNDPDTI